MSTNVTIRDADTYPEKLKLILDLITINETPKVVGSYSYKNHKYPSDVDVFEKVLVKYDKIKAMKFYAHNFKNIIMKLQLYPKFIMISDFKIGEDIIYKPYYNKLVEMKSDDNNILVKKETIINELKNKQLISDSDINDINSNKIDLTELIRNKMILRWTPQEILNEYKKTSSGKIISLSNAIDTNGIIKLDIITWIFDRFQSIEIFYNLWYYQDKFIQFHPLSERIDSLIHDINKYSSDKYYSPLKVAKRVWTLSNLTKCVPLFQVLDQLMSSDAAALNQIQSEIEILEYILSNNNNKNLLHPITKKVISKLMVEIIGLDKRLINHLGSDIYEKEIYPLLQNINTICYNFNNQITLCNDLLYNLKLISEILEREKNIRAQNFISKKNLYMLASTCSIKDDIFKNF